MRWFTLISACCIVTFCILTSSFAAGPADIMASVESQAPKHSEIFEGYSTAALFVHMTTVVESYWMATYYLMVSKDHGAVVQKLMYNFLAFYLIYIFFCLIVAKHKEVDIRSVGFSFLWAVMGTIIVCDLGLMRKIIFRGILEVPLSIASFFVSFGKTTNILELFNYLDAHVFRLFDFCSMMWPDVTNIFSSNTLLVIIFLLLLLFFFGRGVTFYFSTLIISYSKVAICGVLLPLIIVFGVMPQTRWIVFSWARIVFQEAGKIIISSIFMAFIISVVGGMLSGLYAIDSSKYLISSDYLYALVGVITFSAFMGEMSGFTSQLFGAASRDTTAKTLANLGGAAMVSKFMGNTFGGALAGAKGVKDSYRGGRRAWGNARNAYTRLLSPPNKDPRG
ncbi:hypothetical protein [uncultured Pseudodesulfovibrio sp.]|uniref:hypothetical protein n=1 Tax=uncultured Pseudodesulfovibrio sp. TaxID=2035858 RepID=UPI0029C9778E|nr:hypothetical protein [uncultured Pseudodesulfovibrio sp.]